MTNIKNYRKITLNSVLLTLILFVGIGLLLSSYKDSNIIASPTTPVMPGQEAFGTIQEIIGILESDLNTDWSSVDIDALLEHLIDMDELTMNANVEREEIPNGLQMTVTGEGRTIDAIQRMVPTHNSMTLSSFDEWQTEVEIIDIGAILTVTSNVEVEVDKIRGLGFIGIMSVSSNHQLHHLMMAKGMAHMFQ